jgi:5-(carboxyamino)imidazole ribonucleotide synthase
MNQLFPTIGILGGGQLGRMSALAAIRLGVNIKTLSPETSGPVASLGEAVVGDWNDPVVMRGFVEGCSVVTVESEWAPAELAESVIRENKLGIPVYPTSGTLSLIRHKGIQRKSLTRNGLPGADFMLCRTVDDALAAAGKFGFPVMFKRYQGSYDGYGNATVQAEADIPEAWHALADEDGLLVEAFVPFVRELAVMVARRPSGESHVYPVVHIEQRNHRCHSVVVPAPSSPDILERAAKIAIQAADTVKAIGMLGVELFETESGEILVNELAPRPHNSGHYSIEACHTSQFENHVRAILDWPLGDPALKVPAAAMVNVLGHRAGSATSESLTSAATVSTAGIHIYGKSETRPDRKMGHVTVCSASPEEALQVAEECATQIRL